MIRKIEAGQARWSPPDEWIVAASTAEIEPSRGIIGQARAVRALEFGLAVPSLGFNVFLTGLTGTGKMTAIEMHLRPLADRGPTPDDLLCVHNFIRPEQPRMLRLGPGRGIVLRDRLDRFVRELQSGLPGLFSSEDFEQRLDLTLEDLKARHQERQLAFERRVQEAGFALVQVQAGPVAGPEVLPVIDGRPVALEKLHRLAAEGKLPQARLEELMSRHRTLSDELAHVFRELMAIREEMAARAAQLRRAVLEPAVRRAVEEIAAAVADDRVAPFLDDVARDLLDNVELLSAEDGDSLLRYTVNVVVENGGSRRRPVVIETEPTFGNLFGTVESRIGEGLPTSDHSRVRAGSLLRANGGYLVLNAFDVISEPGVWPALKRALRFRRAVVRPRETLFAFTGQALQPEAVELDVKVVMVGDRGLYAMLLEADEEFRKIFKVLADFDSEMASGPAEIADFLALMSKIIHDEDLPNLSRSGMIALIEEAVRLAGGRRRVSARFSDVADILREAAFLARAAGAKTIGVGEIRSAVVARRDRHALPEEKMTSLMVDGVLVVPSSGRAVGQVNGLAVYEVGTHAFGLPGRVSARVSLGREGVVSVERDSRLSGRSHDKGLLILSGYLRSTFATEKPLSMCATLAFEQSYSEIDGDSASSTEIYAILSALCELPLRQDLAVTGSVDQQGRVQAIGGVNEKIEAFFQLCAARGLSGTQGVMIPAANAADLQLDPAVVAAIAAGRFHVFAVDSVEDGIEVLCGVPAGTRGRDGAFPPDSVLGRCAARLDAMAESLRRFRDAGAGCV